MKLILADESKIDLLGNRGERELFKTVYRDSVRFFFDPEQYTDQELRALFLDESKTQTMQIEGAEKPIEGYILFVRSIYEDEKIGIVMAKTISERETQLMQQTETQEQALATILGISPGTDVVAKAQTLRTGIDAFAACVPDDVAAQYPALFKLWDSNAYAYIVDDRVQYDNLLYKCLTEHTSQANWKPGTAPSLWVRVDDPAVEWPEWRQPEGGHDAYVKSAKVSHSGKHWISDVDGNVWEPPAQWTEANDDA